MKVKVAASVLELVEAEMDEYGRYDEEKEKIFIRSGLEGLQRVRTEFHEILHAIWNEYDLPPEQEESCVKRLESGIVSFVLDNPEYAKKMIASMCSGGKRG